MGLLHIHYIKKYNDEIGGVGIAENLRNYYIIYFWVSNRKWWWYIYFGLLVSSTRMHIFSTDACIIWMVLQGDIDYIVMILERQ